jgi:hypothetical protein
MNLTKVNSQTVEAIGYNEKEQKLQVEFPNGSQYLYSDVSRDEYFSIKAAASIGSKLKEVVKGKPYKKI